MSKAAKARIRRRRFAVLTATKILFGLIDRYTAPLNLLRSTKTTGKSDIRKLTAAPMDQIYKRMD